MKLTKAIIPLPYSDCLLTESELRTVVPITYATGGLLKQAVKVSACLCAGGQFVICQRLSEHRKK